MEKERNRKGRRRSMKEWFEDSCVTRQVLLVIAVMAVLMVAVRCAYALEPGWYAPGDGSGQALNVRCNVDDQCVIEWDTYTEDHGQVFLLSEGLCSRDELTCEDALDITEGCFDGQACKVKRMPTGAVIAVEQIGDTLLVEWDVRELRGKVCEGGIGDLLLKRCVNTTGKRFMLLAQ